MFQQKLEHYSGVTVSIVSGETFSIYSDFRSLLIFSEILCFDLQGHRTKVSGATDDVSRSVSLFGLFIMNSYEFDYLLSCCLCT